MNNRAFTLAEVLITLGIIGVVAAMTLPNLVAKYRSSVVVAQLKKLYTVTSQAMMKAVPDGDYNNIPVTNGGSTGAQNFFNDYIKAQFNILKTCLPYTSGCWTQSYNKNGSLYGTVYGYNSGDSVNFITTDGFTYSVDTWNANDFETVKQYYGVNVSGLTPMVVIHVDANGKKGPNTLGKDVFIFVLSEKGLLPAGSDKTDAEVKSECQTTGRYCFSHIIRNNWKINPEDAW